MILTLQPGAGATLPAQLLSVKLQRLGAPGAGPAVLPELEAVALTADGGERALTDVIRHSGTLVLAVHEPTLIRIRPSTSSGTFPTGSVYGLVVGPEGTDSDRAALKSVDASGLRSCSLVTLSPSGPDVVVTAVAQAAQVVLPPVADQARATAREVVGAPRVSASEAVAVRVVIDASASFRPVLACGWLAAMIELVSGVATVISSAASLPVTACGRSQFALGDHQFAQPGTATADEVVEIPPSIGFRSALVPSGGGHGLTYVITDGVPADLGPASRDLVHLILLGVAPLDGSGRTEAAGTRTALVEGRPWSASASASAASVTKIEVEGGADTLSADQVRAIARSLLAGYEQRLQEARGVTS
jgi:hypothetical protein